MIALVVVDIKASFEKNSWPEGCNWLGQFRLEINDCSHLYTPKLDEPEKEGTPPRLVVLIGSCLH